jgi:hypothetical protein
LRKSSRIEEGVWVTIALQAGGLAAGFGPSYLDEPEIGRGFC